MKVFLLEALALAQQSIDLKPPPPSSAPQSVTAPGSLQLTPPPCPAFQLSNGLCDNEIKGAVKVTCTVTPDTDGKGHLSNCIIVSDDPPNEGFGAATLKLTKLWVMKPKVVDGKPVEGTFTTIVKWKVKP